MFSCVTSTSLHTNVFIGIMVSSEKKNKLSGKLIVLFFLFAFFLGFPDSHIYVYICIYLFIVLPCKQIQSGIFSRMIYIKVYFLMTK